MTGGDEVRLLSQLFDRLRVPGRAAGLFLCKSPCARTLAHFDRLRWESAGFVDWALLEDKGHLDSPRDDDGALHPGRVMPRRFAAAQARGQLIGGAGLMDVVIMPRVIAAPYEFVWALEYDVDYSGNWADFFRRFARNQSDVLTTTLLRRTENPDWVHWATARTPPDVDAAHCSRDFHPLMRLSRRFATAYAAAMAPEGWEGHYEFTIPTMARHLGYRIEDMKRPGLFGRFSAPLYDNTPADETLGPGSFIWRPARAAYFHECPEQFDETGRIYHPVKPVMPVNLEIIVPVCNAQPWIETIMDGYAALGVTPLYILDTRSSDASAALLKARGARVLEASGAHARVESLLCDAVPRLAATWILRFDDDELPSDALLAWVRETLPALDAAAAGFPRLWVAPAAGEGYAGSHCNGPSVSAGGQPCDDRQYRLFRPGAVSLIDSLHTPGIAYESVCEAPAAAVIYHFDWLIRDRAARARKVAAYEAQTHGGGARYAAYYLPEDHDPQFYEFTPLADSMVTGIAARLVQGRVSDAKSPRPI